MASGIEHDRSSLPGLQSTKSVQRLEQISALRGRGIGEHIALPQLVVCGDRAVGKSSVFEGISGVPFPRGAGLCTKFPTEIILEHTEAAETISATIIPHVTRSDAIKTRLQAFQQEIGDFNELSSVIASAGALMGLRGYGGNECGPSFVEDVLRIKVSGRTGLHLSIFDLPGLIACASEDQSEKDVESVHRLVDSYLENPRTIILAVVQASNRIANQSIVRKSKQYDVAGQRTVGIITQADLINVGAEVGIATLAKNEDTTKLSHGFFLVKNPTPVEIARGITLQERSANELGFFSSSPWKEQRLDSSRVGILNLRYFCETFFDERIERELPKIREEIRTLIRKTESDLSQLPKERPTVGDMRTYLSRLAMQFHGLADAAVKGEYDNKYSAFFASQGKGPDQARLRALVHEGNSLFQQCMHEYGQTYKRSQALGPENQRQWASANTNGEDMDALMADGWEDAVPSLSVSALQDEQKYVTMGEMRAWIKSTYVKSKGRELPGNYDQVLLTELYHQQSKKWSDIAEAHLGDTMSNIIAFIDKTISYLKMEQHVEAGIREGLMGELEKCEKLAEDELRKLCADEAQQPVECDHYHSDKVQKSANSTIIDMDEQACTEALNRLEAYYKMALDTFVDNTCRQVIERHLLRTLPCIFSPQRVAGYTDQELERLAGEKAEVVEKRKQLHQQLENLRAGLKDLCN
ncbi:uncharacterized protein LTR77_002558 [Saxophila tyrrhenica]|uniref:Uncharacterized protein n=1 Tax=Saxophila tyrrhenica TaxID=1690608 RepID=A0AAV9PLK2_9PEZI|nr:hypothetical protein LTR77_002558 [Saxophila tyrrhenica]